MSVGGSEQQPELVDALGERLLRASGSLMDMELTASHEGDWKRAMRLKAKRSGVELALSYLNEEIRLREVDRG